MHINVLNIDNLSATECRPNCGDPVLLYVSGNQDMKVSISVLLVFENPNVREGYSKFAFHINPEVRENFVDVLRRVFPIELLRI